MSHPQDSKLQFWLQFVATRRGCDRGNKKGEIVSRKLIIRILTELLFEYPSDELDVIALDLHLKDEPLAEFCDRFELGNWFYDQMTLADIDIVDEVSAIADEHRKTESEQLTESQLLRRELQQQGV